MFSNNRWVQNRLKHSASTVSSSSLSSEQQSEREGERRAVFTHAHTPTPTELRRFGYGGRRRCGFLPDSVPLRSTIEARMPFFQRQCSGRKREGRRKTDHRCHSPLFSPLFPISTFLASPPFLPDSIGNFRLLLQSSQPLLTH